MSLLRAIGSIHSKRGYKRFLKAAQNPEKSQERIWSEIKTEISDSRYWKGRLHFRSKLSDYEITDYEDYRASIESGFSDLKSPLSGKEILYWAESSGTSGKRKLFPITDLYRKQFQRTTPPMMCRIIEKFPNFLNQKVLYFAAMTPVERSPAGIEVGFLSNYNYRNIRPLMKKAYAFPTEVFKDWDTFQMWAPLYALATDISGMFATTPSVITRFSQSIRSNFALYLHAMKNPQSVPAFLPKVRVSENRLEVLDSLKNKSPQFHELWPSLQMVCCWKSSACSLQLAEMEPVLGGEIQIVDATYAATESWINVPLAGKAGGPVHPEAHLFEFIPAGSEIKKENLIPMWALEPDREYEIFVTTAMGLVRYRVYDMIRCTGYFEKSPVIEFVRKSLNEIILAGSFAIRVSEDQILKAVQETGRLFDNNWFFGPNLDSTGLVFYFRNKSAISADQLKKIDSEVESLNKYYANDISRGALRPLTAIQLAGDHPVWNISQHAQTKPRIMQLEAPLGWKT